jgi:hypothetical protein
MAELIPEIDSEYTESFFSKLEDKKAVCARCGTVKILEKRGYWRYFQFAEWPLNLGLPGREMSCGKKHQWRRY